MYLLGHLFIFGFISTSPAPFRLRPLVLRSMIRTDDIPRLLVVVTVREMAVL